MTQARIVAVMLLLAALVFLLGLWLLVPPALPEADPVYHAPPSYEGPVLAA